MSKKIIVITGTTSGIGVHTAIELARPGHTLYMLVRNVEKGEQEKRNILVQTGNNDVYVIPCDLADMQSVKKAATVLISVVDKIDVLVNNSGGMFSDRQLTTNGFEKTFAVNYLGHFLLTLNLMPLLKKGQARVINVSSEAHKAAKFNPDDLQFERSYSSIKAYANAKLCSIYFSKSLAEKYAGFGITAFSLHPGVVNTSFGEESTGLIKLVLNAFRPFMITPEQGAETTVFLAVEPGLEKFTGMYFKKKKLAKPAIIALDAALRELLWDKSLELVKSWL